MRVCITSPIGLLVLCVAFFSPRNHLVAADDQIPPECPDSSNTTFLDCKGRSLIAIPTLDKKVAYLDISSNRIDKLGQQQWPNLVYLNLSQNLLKTIEENAFLYLKSLTTLDLSFNLLSGRNITSKTFENEKLDVLILQGNPIKVLGDRAFDFIQLPALRYLDLSFSMISKIDNNAIDVMTLEQLSLRGNLLSEHDFDIFSGLELSLKELDISENPITRINDKVFYPLGDLKRLTIESCQLRQIGDTAFQGLDNLLYLSLRNNSLSTLSAKSLQPICKLEELVLDENPFKVIDGTMFGELDGFTWPILRLRLDNMPELSSIKGGAFVNLKRLVEISIQNNDRLKTIDGSVFSAKIRRVHLDNNGLSTLSGNLLPWDDLESITLTGNRWYCDCRWVWAVSTNVLQNISSPIICNGPLEHQGLDLLDISPEDLGCVNRTTKIVLLFFLVVGVITLMGFSVYFALKFRRKSRYSMKDLLCLACWRKKDGRYISVYQNDDTEPFTRITFSEEEDAATTTAVDV